MFERQFGLRENPFAAGHQSRFVYPSHEHQEALAHLRFGIENREPFVLITGEVGTGKTTALYDVLAEWETRAVVALITNSALTRDELLEEICLRFGLPLTESVTKPQALSHLERFLQSVCSRGHRAILLLDEAQNLSHELLEEIRLLSNLESRGDKLLQVFLVGQPELEAKLSRPELRQLRQRITVHYRLSPLSEEDTERYIHHRLSVAGGNASSIFPANACREVYRLTHGIPREINTVAAQAMLHAFVDDSLVVLPEHVRDVENDTEFKSVLRGGEAGAAATVAAAPASTTAPPETPYVSPPATQAGAPPAASPAPPATPPQAPLASPTPAPTPAPSPPVATPADTEAPATHIESTTTASPGSEASVAPAGTADAWQMWLGSLGESAIEPVTSQTSAEPPAESASIVETPPAAPAPVRLPESVTEESVREARRGEEVAFARETFATERAAPEELPAVEAQRAESRLEETIEAVPRIPRRLEFLDDEPEDRSSIALRWMIAATIVALLGMSAIIAFRLGAFKRFGGGERVAPATTSDTARRATPIASPAPSGPEDAATAPSTQPVRTAPPLAGAPGAAAPSRVPSPERPGATSPRAATTAAGSVAAGAVRAASPTSPPHAAAASESTRAGRETKPPAPPPAIFGVAVGTYLNQDRAAEESTKLTASTNLPAQMLTLTENNVEVYRIVMGSFADRLTAERMASSLIERGLVDEARVVPLANATPPKR